MRSGGAADGLESPCSSSSVLAFLILASQLACVQTLRAASSSNQLCGRCSLYSCRQVSNLPLCIAETDELVRVQLLDVADIVREALLRNHLGTGRLPNQRYCAREFIVDLQSS